LFDVVRRTGAGKSSIATALFRVVEPLGGAVLIDGVDFRAVPLQRLRSALSIIAQVNIGTFG
jgi:ABC-type multidrug transport system fused ATPase/permease subunit